MSLRHYTASQKFLKIQESVEYKKKALRAFITKHLVDELSSSLVILQTLNSFRYVDKTLWKH